MAGICLVWLGETDSYSRATSKSNMAGARRACGGALQPKQILRLRALTVGSSLRFCWNSGNTIPMLKAIVSS